MKTFTEVQAWLAGQAEGALPKGTRIAKSAYEENDAHQIGDRGTVISSIGPMPYGGREKVYMYFVEWDDMPGVQVGIIDYKIEEINGSRRC